MPVERMIYFGSRVSGTPSEDSDIDLVIVSQEFAGRAFRYRPVGFYEFWKLNHPVDFFCYTSEEFEKFSKQVTIVREAVETGIEIK